MLKRLKEFTEVMVKSPNNEVIPLIELINLCHEEISANDTYIFKDSSIMKDDGGSISDLFAGGGAS
jgi:hypothetical protein